MCGPCVSAVALAVLLMTAAMPIAKASPAYNTVEKAAPRVIFAGLNTGKVHQSADGGATWQESDAGLAGGAIYPFAAVAGVAVYSAPGDSGV